MLKENSKNGDYFLKFDFEKNNFEGYIKGPEDSLY